MFHGAFRGVLAGSLFLSLIGFGAQAAAAKTTRPVDLDSGSAIFEGSLEAGEVRLDAQIGAAAFSATLRAAPGALLLFAGAPDSVVLSLTVSATAGGVRQSASFGDLGTVDRIIGGQDLLALGTLPGGCSNLAVDPSFAALQRVNIEIGEVLDQLSEPDLWLTHLLDQLEQTLVSASDCADEGLSPATGRCSIQPHYLGCVACCEISQRLSAYLIPICENSLRGAGGISGGFPGGLFGGLVGDLMCTPMMLDQSCYSRCTGKDGDPDPIPCWVGGTPEDAGVCRQVCEMGQHDIGPASCPIGGPFPLRCCLHEYEPSDDDPCPTSLCPGPACPPECDGVID